MRRLGLLLVLSTDAGSRNRGGRLTVGRGRTVLRRWARFVDELKRDLADETFYAPGFEPARR